jgi:RNA polymerase sigma-B factor
MDVDKTTDTLTEELGRSPTVAELADELELTTEEVLEAIQAGHARKTASLDEPRRGGDEQVPLLDTMGRSEHGYERVESSLAAENAELDEREQRVLCWRFNEGLTQKEIAKRLGVSQMQVSRIQRAALRKLLGAVRGEGP